MNNEIKEILEALRDSIDDTGTNKINFINWVNKIEDYITNLQQENKRLKEEKQRLFYILEKVCEENERLKEELEEETLNKEIAQGHRKQVQDIELQERHELVDYKSRCEKAIEYIKDILYPIGTCVNGSDLPYESIESLLNILQNGSDSQ